MAGAREKWETLLKWLEERSLLKRQNIGSRQMPTDNPSARMSCGAAYARTTRT